MGGGIINGEIDTAIFMSFIGTDSNIPWMSGHLLHIVKPFNDLFSFSSQIAPNYTEGKSLAIYFEDSQFRRNRTFNFILSKIYVDKRSRVRRHKQVEISHNVKSDFMPPC